MQANIEFYIHSTNSFSYVAVSICDIFELERGCPSQYAQRQDWIVASVYKAAQLKFILPYRLLKHLTGRGIHTSMMAFVYRYVRRPSSSLSLLCDFLSEALILSLV